MSAAQGDRAAEAPPARPAEAQAPPTMLAVPISPPVVAEFPHLAAFQGHILLGGPDLQAVLAGIPLSPPARPTHPALLAVFVRTRDEWRRKATAAAFDLANAKIPGLKASSVDVGVDTVSWSANATYIFSGGTPEKPTRHFVSYRLDLERLTVVFDDAVQEAGNGPAANWIVQLWGLGSQIEVASEERIPRAGPRPWLSYLMGANGSDQVSLIGFRPFLAEPGVLAGELNVMPAPDPQGRQAVHGFELWLTRSGVARTVRRAADIRECLSGVLRPKTLPRPESRLSWISGCGTGEPSTALTLTMPDSEPGQNIVARPMFVFGPAGEPLLQAALLAGDSLTVDVPPGLELQLGDTVHGRLLDDIEPMTLGRGETRVVDVGSRAAAVLRIDLGRPQAPALLTVRRLDAAGEGAGVVRLDAAGPRAEALSNSTWLVRSWPVLLSGLSGGYEIVVERGGAGVFCRRVVRASAEGPITVMCPSPPGPVIDRIFADLGAPGAESDPRAYGAILGVDLLARSASAPAALRRRVKDASLVPVLVAVDEATDVSLSLIPANPSLAGRWERIRPKARQDVLPAFARFAREEGGAGLLELGCPGPGVTEFEYEMLVNRMQPDALRLFGCQAERFEASWLDLWTRLSVARKSPYILTAVSRLEAPGRQGFFPRLVAPSLRGRDPQTVLLAAARAGLLSLSAGARVELTGLTVEPAAAPKGKKSRDLEASVLVAPVGRPVEGVLRVVSERGVLKTETISGEVSEPTEFRLKLPKTDGHNWLRAEIVNSLGGVLATTLYRSIDELVRSAGEGAP